MSALLDAFRIGFDALPPALREAGELGAVRRAALEAAFADGLPKARAERWRYTSLRALERRAFAPSGGSATVDPASIAAIPSPRLVFVNGRFDAALSRTEALPDGLILRPLSAQLAAGDARALDFLARRYEAADETFARVNAALATEGALLRVEAGVRVEAPVHLVFVGVTEEADQAWHLRHRVELCDGSELTVVEHHLAAGAHAHLVNALCHVDLKPAARLTHLRVQDEASGATSLLRTDAALASEAEYRRFDLELGAGLSRHELNVSLQGRGAKLLANGVLLAGGRRHLDTRLGIDHAAPETSSELTWRGLASGRGRAVFHGGIEIRAGADGSEAMLANKNLLLSEGAEIDTQPVLVIHADEVKAAHGATVGRLDPQALFYLRSRGIPLDAARALLTAAFCREPLLAVASGGLADALAARLEARLARAEAGP